ncbi:adenylate/guanylate cyclase domain-containing protein [Desulfovibrio gilichinskyi]|uniref:Adenylate cyclase, class 3 n=1 Tax=Desulfovibrio gilichinskyi TaxID=1519643 RepID=A0A1X7DJ43_9BACT|nr:adenylate/guanylate cyclase domain-containing protein [Desulfovibrio gilichinskyi]SMF16600.1 Adenylate cyclase, class 3 [Desulfovibrio gilichinskyi]
MTESSIDKTSSLTLVPQTSSVAFRGSLLHHVAHEFFSNSAHFPLANILLEALLHGQEILFEPDLYALLCGSLIQAWFLGLWEFKGKNRKFIGNLIGPAVYTVIEFMFDGMAFFEGFNHWAYWGFSILIGLFSFLGTKFDGKTGELFIVLENLVRTLIMLGMYWIFEILSKPVNISPSVFFTDGSHVFFASVVVMLGIIIGLERVNSMMHMEKVVELTDRLGEYSEWLLGRELLSRALSDPETSLGLRRRERYVLFMDIRGFTAWSELHSPEVVVGMLNRYFSLSEDVWQRFQAVKAKYTGDEVMAVFSDGEQAIKAALVFTAVVGKLLSEIYLSVGIGVHYGPLMEGALGSSKVKAYDVIGDTVNTAKRLCDHAEPGEILVSREVLASLQSGLNSWFKAEQSRFIQAKGKRELIEVFPLLKGD